MANQRKKIIMNEILFWKQNKMLPEHYCDFLMTLYSEGEEVELTHGISPNKALKAKEQQKRILLYLLFIVSTVVLLSVLFFVSERPGIVIGSIGIVGIILMISAFIFAKKNELIAPILQVTAALLILGVSVKLSITYFEHNNLVLYSFLIANSLLWLISGITMKLLYFTLSGVLGLIVLIGYNLFV